MPASTSATAKSASFMRRKTASSSASRLTVTRFRPASFSAWALRASSEPLVVSVRSSGRPDGVRSCGEHARPGIRGSCAAAARRRSGGSCARRARRTVAPVASISSKLSNARVRQERVVLVEDLLRHAVDAAEIAAIGDRNAQVAQRPRQCVVQHATGRRHWAGDDRRRAEIGNWNDASGHERLRLVLEWAARQSFYRKCFWRQPVSGPCRGIRGVAYRGVLCLQFAARKAKSPPVRAGFLSAAG